MIFSYLLNMQSHPSWVCGLKLVAGIHQAKSLLSHPSWVCGLKPYRHRLTLLISGVTPFVGVWIET